MLKHFMAHLRKERMPQVAVAEVASLANLVQELAGKVGVLAGAMVGLETILEHHGLLTPEVMEAVKERIKEKLTPQQSPETPPEQSAP